MSGEIKIGGAKPCGCEYNETCDECRAPAKPANSFTPFEPPFRCESDAIIDTDGKLVVECDPMCLVTGEEGNRIGQTLAELMNRECEALTNDNDNNEPSKNQP